MTEYLTKDVDLLTQSDQENRTRLAAALAELGTDATITAADLATNTQWDTNAGHVDVLLTATGPNETFLIYADVAARAEVFEVGAGSVTVTAASLDDIIRTPSAQPEMDEGAKVRRSSRHWFRRAYETRRTLTVETLGEP
jgi:hypothetical protein